MPSSGVRFSYRIQSWKVQRLSPVVSKELDVKSCAVTGLCAKLRVPGHVAQCGHAP